MLQVYQGGFAARATSSDLAAAQALAELRHEDDIMDTDSMESGEEEAEEGEHRGGSSGAGYDRGFRVTAPPLPLWLPGTPSLIPSLICSVLPAVTNPPTQAVTHPSAHLIVQSCVCSVIHLHLFSHASTHSSTLISIKHFHSIICVFSAQLYTQSRSDSRSVPTAVPCAFRLAMLLYVCIHHRPAMLLYQGLQLQIVAQLKLKW